MKLRLTESQYKVLLKEDRITHLKKLSVVDPSILKQPETPETPDTSDMSDEEAETARVKLERKKVTVTPIYGHDDVDVGYIVEKRGKKQIKVTEEVFDSMVAHDPSPNKQYVQWMLDVFNRHIKEDNDIAQASRFVTEDLGEVEEFLGVFHKWKEKGKFKRGAANRPNAPENPKDIRQYKNLAHLYSVISPFMSMGDDDGDDEDDGVSKLYKSIKSYVDLGQADIRYHDPSVVVYVPNHIDASCGPLGPLASWCTRREDNSYFDSYRNGDRNRKPDGSTSDIYVIMPKELFDMENPADHSEFPYQFHFESGQLHDKSNRPIDNGGIGDLMSDYPGLTEFFRSELGQLAADAIRSGNGLMDNKYIKYLNQFGGRTSDYVPEEAYQEGVTSIKELALEQKGPINNNKYLTWLLSNEEGIDIIDYLPLDIDELDFSGINLGELPDLSMFKDVLGMSAMKCNLTKFPSGDKLPPNITFMTLHGNQIKNADFEGFAENLKDLYVVNLMENPVQTVGVENIQSLINASGSFHRISLSDPRGLTNYSEYDEMIKSESAKNKLLYFEMGN